MSSQFKEMLSAVMDGEASEFETRRLFDEAQRSPELRGVWSRYHLIGAALRREGRGGDPQAALDRLWARVDAGAESNERGAVRSRRFRIAALASSAAVAIVVLGIAVDTGQRRASKHVAEVAALQTEGAGAVADPGDAIEPASFVRDVPSESDVARARAYMLHHARHLPRVTGGVQYVKVAAFESR